MTMDPWVCQELVVKLWKELYKEIFQALFKSQIHRSGQKFEISEKVLKLLVLLLLLLLLLMSHAQQQSLNARPFTNKHGKLRRRL